MASRGKARIVFNKGAEAKLRKQTVAETNNRLNICGIILRNAIIDVISVPTATHGPSLPGEPPHADTGALKRSIFSYIKNGILYVGSALKYAWWLEVGTRRMAPRPYLRSTFNRLRPILIKILRTGRP